jgi:CxxC-x17-CxxC domain-containing protein
VYQDKSLTCSECGAEFIFTSKDQAYYTERGFAAPKRCKPCRDAKKAQGGGGGGGRGGHMGGGGGGGFHGQPHHAGRAGGGGGGGWAAGGGGGGGGGGGFERQNRVMYDATCSSCGQVTTVPFRPAAGRPVYCRDCYRAGKGGSRGPM